MTAKDELNAIRDLDRQIQNIIERCDNLFDSATRATGSMEAERVSGTGERSKLEMSVCRMVDMEREAGVDRRVDELADMRRAAESIIDRIPYPYQRQVLKLRYLQNESWRWTWDMVAARMGKSVRGIHTLHGWALVAFENARKTPPNAV